MSTRFLSAKERGSRCIFTIIRMLGMTVEHRKLLGDVKEEELVETEINEKDYQMIVFESPMLEFINEQHYHGLAQTGDMETPAKLKKGMSGIATCYEKELF